jgi:hypothetical protein
MSVLVMGRMRGLVGVAALIWLCGLPASRAGGSPDATEPSDGPTILNVRVERGEVVASVQVPSGVRKVTLESRTRLGVGAWVPRAVERLDGRGGAVTFRLPMSAQLEVLRVRGDVQEALPAYLYSGQTNFAGPVSATDPASDLWRYGVPGGEFDGNTTTPNGGGAREVVESDIWAIQGETLCFFNQYRGLQVVDLQVPDAPRLRGELAIPAAGEQMYLIEGRYAVLLARNGCGWYSDEASQVLVIDIAASTPGIVARAAIDGTIVESRLVGQVLYVASQTYRKVVLPPSPGQTDPSETWEWGIALTSIDLATPTAPLRRGVFWNPGYGQVIAATEKYLMLVTYDANDWNRSNVRLLDISASDGAVSDLATLRAAGRVADKFKLNVFADPTYGDVLTVISESTASATGQRAGVIETFSLATPTAPRRLGRIEVGHGEGLYATRFDGDRVYLVTFLRIDPLWVVDLADPARPRLLGELQVPGWSTYIQPLGDRLVTIGIDNSNSWRVAVSLFDVADPARPALLSRVPLGSQGSYSEATWDEKAFTVLPEAGLILVPYEGWSTNGYASQVQLIDLDRDSVRARGVIDHRLQPRRATVHANRIVSISGQELLVVDAGDRDRPQATATLELSWPVDRALLAGDFLIEVTGGSAWAWYGSAPPWLRVTRAQDPTSALRSIALDCTAPVLGASVRGDRLYLVQGSNLVETSSTPPVAPPPPTPNLRLTVYDLSALPDLRPLGIAEAVAKAIGSASTLDPLWVRPGLLVWTAGGGYPWLDGYWRGGPVDSFGGGVGLWWPYWGTDTGVFEAFDVADPAHPRFVSEFDAVKETYWWGTSPAFTAAGLVFLSHQDSQFVTNSVPPGKPPTGNWITHHYLDVVDFADAANPTLRPPPVLPSQLLGVGLEGALLFTKGYRYNEDGTYDGSTQFVDALSYDGVKAARISSLALPNVWPQAVLAVDRTVHISSPDAAVTGRGQVETWAFVIAGPGAGTFQKAGVVALPTPPYSMSAVNGLGLASDGIAVHLLDLRGAGAPKFLGSGGPDGCVGVDLSHADGTPERGAWIPLHDYGVFVLPVNP